jgi:DNA-binding NtrC family response regulator
MGKQRILASLCSAQWRAEFHVLTMHGMEIVAAETLQEHRTLLPKGDWDLILVGASGHHSALLEDDRSFGCSFLVLATDGGEELAVQALRAGCSDYLRLPCSPEDLLTRVSRHARPQSLSPEGRMVGKSFAIASVLKQLRRVAGTKANVLLTGETGTGKEVAAEMIHLNSDRAAQRFVSVNCAAIPEALLESELFGYERGAFTGAQQARPGKLEYAAGGTVFLDEIGDMNLFAQAKILRALESQKIQRLGDHRDRSLDIRVVAATHRDLESLVAKGEFRQDLFFRLNVVHLHVPALRERREDIAPLFRMIVDETAAAQGKKVVTVAAETIDRLLEYHWPGNVRELRNAAEWAVTFAEGNHLTAANLPDQIRGLSTATPTRGNERERILFALSTSDWNKSAAARQLKCSRMTLYRKLERHGIASA